MIQERVTLLSMVQMQNDLRRKYYADHGLPEESPVLQGLASGLDTTLTIMEAAAGPFQGLNQEAAAEIMDYFSQEYYAHKDYVPEIAYWYLAWAKTLEQLFMK